MVRCEARFEAPGPFKLLCGSDIQPFDTYNVNTFTSGRGITVFYVLFAANEGTMDSPPVFKSWRTWYWLVLIVLLLQIILYSWITASFA